MRAIAVVTISFGLVKIPARIYAAVESKNEISFRLLHAKCSSPLKQQHSCAKCDVVVDRADVIKGYEFAKERFVTFTAEELAELGDAGDKPDNQSVDVEYFIDEVSQFPLSTFVEKSYFVGPDAGSETPFAALVRAMVSVGRAAVAKYTSRGRTHLVVLGAAEDDRLEMVQLRAATEVRSIADVPMFEPAEPSAATVRLTAQVIQSMTRNELDLAGHVDEVQQRLEERIRKKETAAASELELQLRASLKPKKKRARRAAPAATP